MTSVASLDTAGSRSEWKGDSAEAQEQAASCCVLGLGRICAELSPFAGRYYKRLVTSVERNHRARQEFALCFRFPETQFFYRNEERK